MGCLSDYCSCCYVRLDQNDLHTKCEVCRDYRWSCGFCGKCPTHCAAANKIDGHRGEVCVKPGCNKTGTAHYPSPCLFP